MEVVPEALKNMLLVMAARGVLTPAWKVTPSFHVCPLYIDLPGINYCSISAFSICTLSPIFLRLPPPFTYTPELKYRL